MKNYRNIYHLHFLHTSQFLIIKDDIQYFKVIFIKRISKELIKAH